LKLREIKSCILQILFDEFIYSEKGVRKVKDITNTDKLLVAGIAKPQSFWIYRLQMMYGFPGSSSFQRKEDILDIKNKSLKRSSLPEGLYAITGKNTSDQLFIYQ
jgi:tetraacyldisaccharide 4'-kinase